MSWFKRKEEKIPLPPSSQPNVLRRDDRTPSPAPPSYRTYNTSNSAPYSSEPRSGSSYGDSPSPQPAAQDRFGRGPKAGDPYSRAGAGNVDSDRNELFSGYNPERSNGGNRFANAGNNDSGRFGGWRDRTPQNQEEEEADVEAIKADTRRMKEETLESSRNALRIAREAEETGRATLSKLADQSEKLASTEAYLIKSKANITRADDRTSEIKQLNRSIFIPVVTFNKEGKRKAKEERDGRRLEEERRDRENAMLEARDSQNIAGRAGSSEGGWAGGSGRMRNVEERKRYRFAETQEEEDEDDQLEDELDNNLDELLGVTKSLNNLAVAQGQVVAAQNKGLERMNERTRNLGDNVDRTTDKLRRL